MGKTQENTYVSVHTPLGPNALILESFTGVEEISAPFLFELELVSENNAIAFDKLIGQSVTLQMEVVDGMPAHRYVNGLISRFVQRHTDNRYTYYRAEVVPWIWLLSRVSDCRIFQEKSVPEIIKEVCKSRGLSDIDDKLQDTYPPITYCVQYRERDLDFISRLMEEAGICYFFRHEKDRHVLVLADAPGAFEPCEHQSRVRFREDARVPSKVPEPGVITELSLGQELHTGKYTHSDYNFETPSQELRTSSPTRIAVGGNSRFERYDYPGRYRGVSQGERLARLRIEENETPHLSVEAASTCRALIPGYRFGLVSHYRSDINRSYLVARVTHHGISGELTEGAETYTNRLQLVPADAPYRPRRLTPKPIVQGPQTAVVVGPAGEEIHTDKYGRVKVHFHWDRKPSKDEHSSCWVRVSQHWAGANYGTIFIPRIGQEVVVDFLEGDPDQPLIVGRVYNASQMPPYALPDQRTQSGMKTNSSKGGGGSNELRFEDKKGSEEVYIHAQKDFNEVVENNHSTTVKADQSNAVSGQQSVTVKKDQTITVSEGNRTLTVAKGAYAVKVDTGTFALTVGQASCTIGAEKEISISSKSATLSASAKQTVTVKSEESNLMLGAPQASAELSAQDKVTLHAKEIAINADQKITLTVGGSSVVLEAAKIAINSTELKSIAAGNHEIKGALVKIN